MKFKVGSKQFELDERGDDAWKWSQRPGGWWLGERTDPEGRVHRKRIFVHSAKGKLGAHLSGKTFQGEWVEEQYGSGAEGGNDGDLVSQFPGKVRKVLVQEGAKVNEGDDLILVEAMKMEFAVKAPFEGKVKKVNVTEGQQVQPGLKFLDLEGGNE